MAVDLIDLRLNNQSMIQSKSMRCDTTTRTTTTGRWQSFGEERPKSLALASPIHCKCLQLKLGVLGAKLDITRGGGGGKTWAYMKANEANVKACNKDNNKNLTTTKALGVDCYPNLDGWMKA